MKKYGFIFAVLTLLLTPKADAAPMPRGAECQIKAVIEEISKRKEPCSPKDWCRSWGLPDFDEYIDVTLNIGSSLLVAEGDLENQNCEASIFEEKKFQLLDEKDFKVIKKGDCILAKTQSSGDEFRAGQWLYDIKIIKQDICF